MFTRRTFLQSAAALFAGAALSNYVQASEKQGKMIWANMLNLGHNMWGDTPRAYTPCTDKLLCEDAVWEKVTNQMAAAGLNMVLIDLGEGIQYQSHPELAIEGSWSIEKLRKELSRLRSMGLEPIPKLNFSACHDTWLGDYSRMVSTQKYYSVCAELIQEVCEIFDHPRFFHLGYDEETAGHQRTYDYVVIRQGELWWHDFLFFVKTVDAQNVRPWIWSDYCWHHEEEFFKRMPKHVLQSNWYYSEEFDPAKCVYVQRFHDLDKAGFDQVPTGSNWANDVNFGRLVKYCSENISKEHLCGFLQTPWNSTTEKALSHHMRAIEQIKAVMY
ncbi:MAG: Tat pathway signal protein [Planctomycetaceae bacterium]|nr:Tat pathway signal protein [Planctomycetaceae bacterium]